MNPCVTELAAGALGLYLLSRGRGVGLNQLGGALLVLAAAVLYAMHWRI